MSEAQVRRLPVIDEHERLCGIVSLGDLSRETDNDCAAEALEGVSAARRPASAIRLSGRRRFRLIA